MGQGSIGFAMHPAQSQTSQFDPTCSGDLSRNHSHLNDMGSGVWEEFVRCTERMLQAAPQSRGFTIDQLTDEYATYQNLTGGFTAVLQQPLSRKQRARHPTCGGSNGGNQLQHYNTSLKGHSLRLCRHLARNKRGRNVMQSTPAGATD